jgi:hypothetical protein
VCNVIQHLTANDELEEDGRKAYRQGSAAIFKYLCDLLGIDISALGSKPKKQKLFDTIQDLVSLLRVVQITHSDYKDQWVTNAERYAELSSYIEVDDESPNRLFSERTS